MEILWAALFFGSIILVASFITLVLSGLSEGAIDYQVWGRRKGWEDGSVWTIAKPFYEVGYYLGGVSERRKARRKSRRNRK